MTFSDSYRRKSKQCVSNIKRSERKIKHCNRKIRSFRRMIRCFGRRIRKLKSFGPDMEYLSAKDVLYNEAPLGAEITHPAEAYVGIGLTSNCSGGGARLVLWSVALFGCEEMAHRKARLVRRCL